MSGAEVLAVLGATSSVITIYETCTAIVRFIQKCQPTETIVSLKPQVDLLANIIAQLRPLSLDLPNHSFEIVLAGCEKELQNLLSLIQDYQKASSTPLLKRTRKSFKIPIWEEKIRQSWTRIQQYQSTISLYLDCYNMKRLRLLTASSIEASLFHIPLRGRSVLFAGRREVFKRISDSINHSTQYPCMLSLTGLGGIGKTEIALELCYRERTTYSVVFWIDATDEARFTEGLIEFANKLSMGQRTFSERDASLAYIQEVAKYRTRPWLLVFDNWEIADSNLHFFFLFVDGGKRDVVITTARASISSGSIHQIEIPPFSEEEAKHQLLDPTLSSSPDEVEAAIAISKSVGYLPLALVQLAGLMRRRSLAPTEFLEMMGSDSAKQVDSSKALTVLFEYSFETIKGKDPLLFDFLLQLSFIAVPAEFMFRDYFQVAQSNGEPMPSFYQLFVQNQQWSSENFLHAVQQLTMYALVKQELIGESGTMIVSMHRLVKDFLQREGLPAGSNIDAELMLQAAGTIAASLSAYDWEGITSDHRNMFRENILECIQQRKLMLRPDLLKRYSGISKGYQTVFAAFTAMYTKEDKLAKDLLLESLDLQSLWLGESAPLTCTTMTWLALFYLESMLLDEAEAMINRLDKAESQAPEPQPISLIDVQFMQGHLRMRKHEVDDSISIFERCTELYAGLTSISAAGTTSALLSGVEAMLIQGKAEEATQPLYEAEIIHKNINSSRSLKIRVKWDMARHSLRIGDHIRAIRRYEDLCEEHGTNHDPFGPPSHRWESFHCDLGDVYLDLGDVSKATAEYDIGQASPSRRSRFLKMDPRDISQWLLHGSLERTKFVPLFSG
ncbi:hypothetical protein N7540_005874 [Penicillium herquei]|nr:hypothetical protein N7540_005874 [Penicillium herquei]